MKNKRKRRSPITYKQMVAFFKKNKCTLISNNYQCNKDKLVYMCDRCGHVHSAPYNGLYRAKSKYFCPICRYHHSVKTINVADLTDIEDKIKIKY